MTAHCISKRSILVVLFMGFLHCAPTQGRHDASFANDAEFASATQDVLTCSRHSSVDGVACGCKAGRILLFRGTHGESMLFQLPTQVDVVSIDVAPDRGLIVAGDKSGVLWIVDSQRSKVESSAQVQAHEISSVAIASDGKQIITCSPVDSRRNLLLVDRATLQTQILSGEGSAPIISCDMSSDGDVWAGDSLGRLLRFSTPKLKRTAVFEARPVDRSDRLDAIDPPAARLERKKAKDDFKLQSVCVSTDGARIVAGYSDGTVRVWPVNARDPVRMLDLDCGPIWTVAVSGDGKNILAGGALQLATWPAEGEARITTIELPGSVLSASFFSNGGHPSVAAKVNSSGLWVVPLRHQVGGRSMERAPITVPAAGPYP